MKKNITLMLLCLIGITASAQTTMIFGDVQDDFLKTPLPEATVELFAADSTTLIKTVDVNKRMNEDGTVRKAQFVLTLERKTADYLIKASLDGYDDVWQPLHINADEERGQMFTLGLRRSLSRKLDEVVVTATKVKMYYKGDTLVYEETLTS